MKPVEIGDGLVLDVLDVGVGEPAVLVQTGLTADELSPLARQLVDRGACRAISYHRRGYGGSSPTEGSGSVVREAADCRELLGALGVDRVHVVGLSYSGAVGLQLAVDAPEVVHTLTLIEPPPVHVPSAAEFREVCARLLESSRIRGPAAALEEFQSFLIGPEWRPEIEQLLPGSAAQMERDAATFFDSDLPGLLAWHFDALRARSVGCPVLHVGGTDSGPWFAEVRDLVLEWLPQAEDVRITGADHSLALTHTAEIADAMSDFLARHPMDARHAAR